MLRLNALEVEGKYRAVLKFYYSSYCTEYDGIKVLNGFQCHLTNCLSYFASDQCPPYHGQKMDKQFLEVQNFHLINTRRD